MGQNNRVGRPLRTDPEQFPGKVPWPTRVLIAELNKLITAAELTYAQIVRLNPELGLSAKKCSRLMGETPLGPSVELIDAIIVTAAAKLDEPVQDVLDRYPPLHEHIHGPGPGLTAPLTKLIPPQPAREEQPGRTADDEKLALTKTDVIPPPPPPEEEPGPVGGPKPAPNKTEWLLTLLCNGQEVEAAKQLDEVFGPDHSTLTAALIDVGGRLPGAIAALLDAICVKDADRGAKLFNAIQDCDEQLADRIRAVPGYEELAPPTVQEAGILDTDPDLLFGRRIANVLQRGDIGGARREVVAKTKEHPDTSKSILGLIIDTGPDGPELVGKLLSAMAESHPEQTTQCVIHLLRDPQTPDSEVLQRFNDALSPELRASILTLLSNHSRIPNTHGLSPGFTDLAALLRVIRPAQLVEALTASALTAAEGLAAGHLVEAVPDFGVALAAMATARPTQTATLLSRALTDWTTRSCTPVAPELYRPVQNLAAAVLELDPASSTLTGEIITGHPSSGMLLFHTMQWLEHPRFPALLSTLIANDDVVEVLSLMVIGIAEDFRRLKIFEKLITQAPESAEPIIRRVVFHDPLSGAALLPPAHKLAPRLVERILVLLAEQKIHSASQQPEQQPAKQVELPMLPPWFAPEETPEPIRTPEPRQKTPPPKTAEPARKHRSQRVTEAVKETRPRRPSRAKTPPSRATESGEDIDFLSPALFRRASIERQSEAAKRPRLTAAEPFPVGEAPLTSLPVIGAPPEAADTTTDKKLDL